MRQALVLVNKIVAGTLTETDDMRYIFKYNDDYLINPKQRAISLAFPKRKEEYTCDELFPFFYNMLSEGSNKATQCISFKIDKKDSFGLLLATAKYYTIGAITIEQL